MANQGRHRYPVEILGEGRLFIGGSFAPNGSSALATASMQGTTGWTAAYTSTGLYTVTLDDKWQYLLWSTLALQLTTKDDKVLQWGAIDMSAKTLQIRSWDIGGADVADIAADAGNRIHWGICVKRSSNSGKR